LILIFSFRFSVSSRSPNRGRKFFNTRSSTSPFPFFVHFICPSQAGTPMIRFEFGKRYRFSVPTIHSFNGPCFSLDLTGSDLYHIPRDSMAAPLKTPLVHPSLLLLTPLGLRTRLFPVPPPRSTRLPLNFPLFEPVRPLLHSSFCPPEVFNTPPLTPPSISNGLEPFFSALPL